MSWKSGDLNQSHVQVGRVGSNTSPALGAGLARKVRLAFVKYETWFLAVGVSYQQTGIDSNDKNRAMG